MESILDTFIFYYSSLSKNNILNINVMNQIANKASQTIIFKDVSNKNTFIPKFIKLIPALVALNRFSGRCCIYTNVDEIKELFIKPEQPLSIISTDDKYSSINMVPVSFTTSDEIVIQENHDRNRISDNEIANYEALRNEIVPEPPKRT